MSVQTPPTLQKLASQTLVKYEALPLSSLQELPPGTFPDLFKEASISRHTKLVKAIVAAWPFPRLCVGALMKMPNLETFQSVLDGVDMQLKREVHPRRTKLQVLDLRNVHHAFWNIWASTEDSSYSAETLDKKQVLKVQPRYALRQRLKIIVNLCIRSCLNEIQANFLKWAQLRKGPLHFCCTKMKIWGLSLKVIREILNVFDPESITELELNIKWTLLQLAHFAPYFGRMRNLRKVFLAPLHKITFPTFSITRIQEVKCIKKFISQFSKFNYLQHFFMNRVHFLRDHMNQVLGCLMMPLETLSITHYQISQRDLDSFSCSQSLFQLKHLKMRSVVLLDLDLMPLSDLLMKVADTLENLDLQGCRMKDSQLSALLPALTQCSQLTNINFYNNDFSMPILKNFLQHTANWSKMNVEQYPAPLGCYDELAHVSRVRFAQLCWELMDTLRMIRQPKDISFSTNNCPTCGECCVYGQGARLCHCWQ